jgi:hypothetical protein
MPPAGVAPPSIILPIGPLLINEKIIIAQVKNLSPAKKSSGWERITGKSAWTVNLLTVQIKSPGPGKKSGRGGGDPAMEKERYESFY